MISFSVDEKNDWLLNNDGNLSLSTEIVAVTEVCKAVVEAQLNEMVYAYDRGMPDFQGVWVGTPNLPQFELSARNSLLSVPGVVEITEFSTQVNDGVLLYRATIKTIYGNTNLNG